MECLFNTISNNVVAYCKYHKCGMTVKQMKCKNCLGKQCHYLKKNEAHDYWRQREVQKQRRKNRRKAISEYVNQFNGS
jgi:hypothetical protein